jgi:hypothetical protein
MCVVKSNIFEATSSLRPGELIYLAYQGICNSNSGIVVLLPVMSKASMHKLRVNSPERYTLYTLVVPAPFLTHRYMSSLGRQTGNLNGCIRLCQGAARHRSEVTRLRFSIILSRWMPKQYSVTSSTQEASQNYRQQHAATGPDATTTAQA